MSALAEMYQENVRVNITWVSLSQSHMSPHASQCSVHITHGSGSDTSIYRGKQGVSNKIRYQKRQKFQLAIITVTPTRARTWDIWDNYIWTS